ncbi:MAG: lysophospholipid acyltransferase family protein [Thermodesulfovibrionia bacterium]|nr:lysophospholipid acyltransferase family protein [Thermodesulfovibrionia bacterium]
MLFIIFLIFFFATSAVFFCIALAVWLFTVLFDKRLSILHQFMSFWGVFYIWAIPGFSLAIEGREKARKGATYIIVSNHQSQLDIMAAFGLFIPFKWVSKAEVFRIPFIGWAMSLNRYIKLVRYDRKGMLRMFRDAERTLSSGSSVFFFPEGTRSETGIVGPFKSGAFILAKKMNLPILPIVINGTGKALPKGSLNFHGKQKISVKVLDEIAYDDFADISSEDLAAKIRDLIAANVDEERQAGFSKR